MWEKVNCVTVANWGDKLKETYKPKYLSVLLKEMKQPSVIKVNNKMVKNLKSQEFQNNRKYYKSNQPSPSKSIVCSNKTPTQRKLKPYSSYSSSPERFNQSYLDEDAYGKISPRDRGSVVIRRYMIR